MRRFHLHMKVKDLAEASRFYSAMFGQEPAVQKPNYLKWKLDEPMLNFAVSTVSPDKEGQRIGVNHIGFQEASSKALAEQYARMEQASIPTFDEENAECCYARSDKHWAVDPAGMVWEVFQTMDSIATYGGNNRPDIAALPKPEMTKNCC